MNIINCIIWYLDQISTCHCRVFFRDKCHVKKWRYKFKDPLSLDHLPLSCNRCSGTAGTGRSICIKWSDGGKRDKGKLTTEELSISIQFQLMYERNMIHLSNEGQAPVIISANWHWVA